MPCCPNECYQGADDGTRTGRVPTLRGAILLMNVLARYVCLPLIAFADLPVSLAEIFERLNTDKRTRRTVIFARVGFGLRRTPIERRILAEITFDGEILLLSFIRARWERLRRKPQKVLQRTPRKVHQPAPTL